MKLAVLLATSATLAATASLAQTPTVEAQLTPFADAMGMERGAVQRALDTVNVVEYTVNGTVAGAKVTGMKIGIDYVIPAIRTDVGTGAARKVEVASGALAWNENPPGVYAGPAPAGAAADRIRLTCLTPHGVILAALVQPQTVKFGTEGAFKTITSACPVGGEMKTTMNADLRPAKVVLTQNGQTYTAEFTNYRHDEQGFEVFFPGRLKITNGAQVMDLTNTQGLPNPYMLFPVPSQVQAAPR